MRRRITTEIDRESTVKEVFERMRFAVGVLVETKEAPITRTKDGAEALSTMLGLSHRVLTFLYVLDQFKDRIPECVHDLKAVIEHCEKNHPCAAVNSMLNLWIKEFERIIDIMENWDKKNAPPPPCEG